MPVSTKFIGPLMQFNPATEAACFIASLSLLLTWNMARQAVRLHCLRKIHCWVRAAIIFVCEQKANTMGATKQIRVLYWSDSYLARSP